MQKRGAGQERESAKRRFLQGLGLLRLASGAGTFAVSDS
jgi:hypothetical protein